MVAHDPLHGSQRAGLPHWALASGDDAHAAQGIRMAYVGRRQPQLDEPAHPLPGDEARLAASRQRTLPEPAHPVPEYGQRSAIHGHSLVSDVPADDRTQPLPHRGNRVVPAMPKLGFHLAQLRLQPFTHRLPKHRVPPVPLLAADVRKAEEVEGLGLGRVSLDFPTRPVPPPARVDMGSPGSRARCFRTCTGSLTARGLTAPCDNGASGVAFRPVLRRRHPGVSVLSRLNTRPARTPVNASPLPLRATTHDSGPLWLAMPSTCGSFIHCTLPVYPGAQHQGLKQRSL